jgi:hypothetical protein
MPNLGELRSAAENLAGRISRAGSSASTIPGRVVGKNIGEAAKESLRPAKQELEDLSRQAQEELDNFTQQVRKSINDLGSEARDQINEFGSLSEDAVRGAGDVVSNEVVRHLVGFTKQVAPGMAAGAVSGGLGGWSHDDPRLGAGRGLIAGGIGGLGGRALGPGMVRSAIGGGLLGGAAGTFFGKDKSEVQEAPKGKNMSSKNKYAGVTLDWYDDEGETLKAVFPTLNDVPEVIKTASIRPKSSLSSEDFALVMIDGGTAFHKYACYDPGTTAMSMIYLAEHGDKLPEDAQKTASANILTACEKYGLTKEAIIGPAMSLSFAGIPDVVGYVLGNSHGREDYRAGRQRPHGVRAVDAAGGLIVPGYIGYQLGYRSGYDELKDLEKKNLEKDNRFSGSTEEDALRAVVMSDLREGKAVGASKSQQRKEYEAFSKNPETLGVDSEKTSSAFVDVTGKSPAFVIKAASPSDPNDYAVVLSDGTRKYPIHTWDMVKTAEAYFKENSVRMEAPIRRHFAVKLASKAESMGYPIDPDIRVRGSSSYADSGRLRSALDMRKLSFSKNSPESGFLDELFEKRAEVSPFVYSECLRRFDLENGLDRHWDVNIPDPWASTFGIKTASVVWEDGADRVTEEELNNLSLNHSELNQTAFTPEMVREFQKDPVGVFQSLPLPQKRMLARLAADCANGGESEGGTKSAGVFGKVMSKSLSQGAKPRGTFYGRTVSADPEVQAFLKSPYVAGAKPSVAKRPSSDVWAMLHPQKV